MRCIICWLLAAPMCTAAYAQLDAPFLISYFNQVESDSSRCRFEKSVLLESSVFRTTTKLADEKMYEGGRLSFRREYGPDFPITHQYNYDLAGRIISIQRFYPNCYSTVYSRTIQSDGTGSITMNGEDGSAHFRYRRIGTDTLEQFCYTNGGLDSTAIHIISRSDSNVIQIKDSRFGDQAPFVWFESRMNGLRTERQVFNRSGLAIVPSISLQLNDSAVLVTDYFQKREQRTLKVRAHEWQLQEPRALYRFLRKRYAMRRRDRVLVTCCSATRPSTIFGPR